MEQEEKRKTLAAETQQLAASSSPPLLLLKYMIAASKWVSFLPTDDYGSAIPRLITALKGRLGRPLPRQVDDLKKQGMAWSFYGM